MYVIGVIQGTVLLYTFHRIDFHVGEGKHICTYPYYTLSHSYFDKSFRLTTIQIITKQKVNSLSSPLIW